MAWTAPRTYVPAELITAAIGNTHWRDNFIELRVGGLAIASQVAGNVLYALSATQLGRLPNGTANQVLRMNSGATAPEWGTVGIRRIIQGSTEITAGNVSATTTITSVNTARAFITVRNFGDGSSGTNGGWVELTNATTVTYNRSTSSGSSTAYWTVVEFE